MMDETISNDLTIWFLIAACIKLDIIPIEKVLEIIKPKYIEMDMKQIASTDAFSRAVANMQTI